MFVNGIILICFSVLVGGAPEYRAYWKNFAATTNLIIFVIDSNNRKRFSEAKSYFFNIMDHLGDDVDFRVVATKADKKHSASVEEIQEALGLEGLDFEILKIAVEAGGASQSIGIEKIQAYCLKDY